MMVASDEMIDQAARDGAWFVFSLSGGKDSGAMLYAAQQHLDQLGHPRERRMALHADLGRAEWRSTPDTVERTAAAGGLPLTVVRRGAGDMVARWEVRFANALIRYRALATYNLIGPWSQANKRFCQSELKVQVMGPHLARTLKGQTIVQVVGIRRDESTNRKATPVSKIDKRFAKPGNRAGTTMMVWNPMVDWTTEQVMDCHARHDIPLHEAYTEYGSTRLSCAFCVLASIRDLKAASSAAGNVELYHHLVGMEASSTFSFQPDRWLGDVAPGLLSPGMLADIERAKIDAASRRAIEEAMPAGLRYVKGWPQRMPTPDEAQAIADARRPILARHQQDDIYPTAQAVTNRFAELIERRDAKEKKRG